MMHAVILAGGRGTRLLPFTKVFPKPLVPLGEKPILDTILRQLKHFGFTRITLAVGHMAELIQTYVGNGERYGLHIEYTFEQEPLGTVGPLAQMPHLGEHFLVMNGDIITNLNYAHLLQFHKQHKGLLTVGTYTKHFQIDLGIIMRQDDHCMTDYIEKPLHTFQVSMGIYVFEAEALQYIEPNKRLDFPDLVKRLLANGLPVVSYPFDGYWLDIGNHSDYEKAMEEYEQIKGTLHLD
ncbi:MAG: sugar phosphate nucleotidyltransferase [Candidatus Tectimicrobiota bacterium]